MQLEGGGDGGNQQDAKDTLILSTGAGKWYNSYVRTRSSAHSWQNADGSVVYAVRLRGVAATSQDWQIQLFLAGNQGEELDAMAPAYVFANTIGLILKPSADGEGGTARFAVKLGVPRASLDQSFLQVGTPLETKLSNVLLGFCVDKQKGVITYFAGDASGEIPLTPKMAQSFNEGAALFLSVVSGASAQKVSAEFSDFSILKGKAIDVPTSETAARLAPATPRPSAGAITPLATVAENFSGAQMPTTFATGGNAGSRQILANGLVLETTAQHWSNSYVRTQTNDLSWRNRGEAITYAFLPLEMPPATDKAALRFFLVGNPPANPDAPAPTYIYSNVLGVTVQHQSEGGYAVKFFAKVNRARAEFNLDWMQVGETLHIANLGAPIGFTLNERANTVVLFAGDQQATAALKADVLPAFEKAMVFVNLVAGNTGVPVEAKVGGVRVFAGQKENISNVAAPQKATASVAPARESAMAQPDGLPFAPLNAVFTSSRLPSWLQAGPKGKVSLRNNRLILQTGLNDWGRCYVASKQSDLSWVGSSTPVTYEFLPTSFSGDTVIGQLCFFLVGNQKTVPADELDYLCPNVMGVSIASNSSGIGWSVRFSAKTDRPKAGFQLPWLRLGDELNIEDLGVPVGFTMDPKRKKITIFAGSLSTQTNLTATLSQAFATSAKAVIAVNTGTAKLDTIADIAAVRIGQPPKELLKKQEYPHSGLNEVAKELKGAAK